MSQKNVMVKSWWFIMVFVVETIIIFCDGFIVCLFFQNEIGL